MAEGVTVGLLHGAADRRPDMREEQGRADVAGELAEVLVVPGRFGAVEDARRVGRAVPTDAEPVAVGRLGPELRAQALGDERVRALVERLLDQDGGAGVCEPAAHVPRLSVGAPKPCSRARAAPSRQANTARGTSKPGALRS